MKCLNCGKDTGRNKYYCSQECRVSYIKNMKTCVVCGKKFYASPSSEKKTCSKACEHLERSEIGRTRSSSKRLILAHEAASKSPNSGRFDTNTQAKSWVIRSPEGVVYEIDNLKKWARDNEDILPSSPIRFYGGIIDIKRTFLGKRKRGYSQYKGWVLLSWSEENNARKKYNEGKKDESKQKYNDK